MPESSAQCLKATGWVGGKINELNPQGLGRLEPQMAPGVRIDNYLSICFDKISGLAQPRWPLARASWSSPPGRAEGARSAPLRIGSTAPIVNIPPRVMK